MCTDHRVHGISRRSFAVMALAGAGVGLIPFDARAAGQIDALCIMCIDYRLVDRGVSYFDGYVGPGNFDIVALAGASLAGVSPRVFVPTGPGFWQQMNVARDLHTISRVIVLDHMECGAYWAEFNGGQPMKPEDEYPLHVQVQNKLTSAFRTHNWGPKGPPPGGISYAIISPTGKLL